MVWWRGVLAIILTYLFLKKSKGNRFIYTGGKFEKQKGEKFMSITALPKLIRTIQKLNGSKGAISLGAKQLKLMAKEDKTLAQALDALEEPAMDVAYKAKSNYNVAAFRLKDGKNTVANGAVSLQNPGSTESILKYRINIGENGAVARSNGFIDTGKKLDLEDVEAFVKRKNGVISESVASGDAVRIAAEVNEKQAIELAEQIKPGSGYGFVGRLKSNSKAGQMIEKLNETWRKLGETLSGKAKTEQKIVDVTAFKKVKPKDIADIKAFAKAHADDIKKVQISDIQKANAFMLDEMSKLKKQFAASTDKETKIKLAEKFSDIESKHNSNLKYIDQLLKK